MDEAEAVEAIAQVLALCETAEKRNRRTITLPIEWVRAAIEAAGRPDE